MNEIKVGILVSYDYKFLAQSLPLLYIHADVIVLAVDKNRRTWAGGKFYISDHFLPYIIACDWQNKILIYEDEFYDSSLTAKQNEVRERNMLAKYMGNGGWHIQIDSDELFYRFDEFVKRLKELSLKHTTYPGPVEICVFFVSVFKKVKGGYLYVSDDFEPISVATDMPSYKEGRRCNYKRIYVPLILVNQNLCRDELDVLQKFKNWGHKDDFDTDSYFRFWQSVNEDTYDEPVTYQSFHPTDKWKWKELSFISSLERLKNIKVPKSVMFKCWLKNIKRSIYG